jgi:hypothetical protein
MESSRARGLMKGWIAGLPTSEEYETDVLFNDKHLKDL